jgi:Antirestriction protein (ArdA)
MLADNLDDLSHEDRLDSRDLEEMIDELEDEQAEAIEDEHDGSWDHTDGATLLDALRELRTATEGEGWHDGIGFISEDDFEDFARELAEDIGAVPEDYTWPTSCIDWKQAARELAMDYSTVTIGKVTFLYREA